MGIRIIVAFCPTETAQTWNTGTAPVSEHRRRDPVSSLPHSLHSSPRCQQSRLLIAQGLGFGNYVVKRMRVASANNVNGKAAGLPVQGWFVVMPGKEWRKKNRAIEHAKNIVTSFAIRKQRKNKETIFFPSPEIEPHKEDVSPALFLCCKIKGLHHVDKENW